ncbi:hypothetical protein FOXG_18075 [Fusarium oxysporum f. sp. lycopersici 4287]|uniref:F-box domain-containing protein n=1 Tax=Fusarium oxysporum f. sp. lycopersici (strain 4287 / CBS 123668 / FGSC 9935 / NRRL 34936) TaxID=426428 RepID=A0A0J9UAF1_FUSO4|nr:hypothetical protein FOXG_18075 [Fusarium oxysporum f. sp. lycopersici 4287]KNA95994.1 hypothetical protein FOXG_18075 [Fusarium oxysporum f. sp. lycopersici 4287]
MLIRWLYKLFCRQTRPNRNVSANTTIDETLETIVHGAHNKPNGEVCTSTGVPKVNIHNLPDKPNDEDWTSSIVQDVVDQSKSNVLREMTEVVDKPEIHLLNLPDEIILLIIKNLYEGSDKPSLFEIFVLRQVSQKFRGLMRDNTFLSHVFSDRGCCEWCTGGFRGKWTRIKPSPYELHCFEHKIKRSGIDIKGLGGLIRMERICKTCRPEFESRQRTGVSLDCKFAARTGQDWMYCCACKVEHQTLCFPSEVARKQSNRVCIARTGYIRICAHEVLSWDELQASLGYGQGVVTKFKKVCKHSSHFFHHNDERQLPTAKAEGNKAICTLHLSSGIHSKESLNETYCQGDGRSDNVEYRNHILPLGMTQMARESEGKSPRVHDEKMAGQTASISYEDCLEDYECLQFRYTRSILPNASAHNLPGHSWYHAISPESYSYAGPCGVPETCSDAFCRNYYSSGLRYRHADYGKAKGYNHLWRTKR